MNAERVHTETDLHNHFKATQLLDTFHLIMALLNGFTTPTIVAGQENGSIQDKTNEILVAIITGMGEVSHLEREAPLAEAKEQTTGVLDREKIPQTPRTIDQDSKKITTDEILRTEE